MKDPTNSKYRYISFQGSESYRRFTREEKSKSLEERKGVSQELELAVHGSYGGLLFDPRWKARRAEILSRDGHSCVICYSKGNVQVHHRQYHFIVQANKYKLPWEYEDSLLITLCESCHKRGHNKFKVPTINI